jgi:hypothetical protein
LSTATTIAGKRLKSRTYVSTDITGINPASSCGKAHLIRVPPGYTHLNARYRPRPLEVTYGHVSEIDCTIGQQVSAGDIIAKEGNHGVVYAGNVLITLAMQAAGDRRGNHRHYQKRPVIKTSQLRGVGLQTAQGMYRDAVGNYYQVYDYSNGFNGCVDWTKALFNRDLYFGNAGYDVLLFQRALVLEGYATFQPTGYFGALTLIAARQYQLAHGIKPTFGYVGSMDPGRYFHCRWRQCPRSGTACRSSGNRDGIAVGIGDVLPCIAQPAVQPAVCTASRRPAHRLAHWCG